jgi:hypothetical protein
MGFKKCSACQKWYDASLGGCLNASCGMADRARVARVVTTPVHPQTKAPMQFGVLPTVALKPITKTAVIEQPKQALPEIKLKSKSSGQVSPVAITYVQGESLLDSEIQVLEAGHHILYRGDSRSPAEIKNFGGFSAWVPLDVDGARQVVRRGLGKNFNITLPTKAKRLENLFNSDNCQNLTLLTLARQIKLEKAGDTFHVSTDPTEGCGGYANGYIYAMRFRTLFLVDKHGAATPGAFNALSRVNTKLVLDTQSLDTATTIAVAIDPEEVAFLTTVPIGQIYKYKEPKGHVWYKMPD